MGLIKPYYQVFKPAAGGTFEEEWSSCKCALEDMLALRDYQVFRWNIFISVSDDQDFRVKRQLLLQAISRHEGLKLLPCCILPQRPEPPYQIIMETGMVKRSEFEVAYHYCQGIPFATVKNGEIRECWISGMIEEDIDLSFGKTVTQVFEPLTAILSDAGFSFNQIIRQWNYVGNILDLEGRDQQHYQIFNNIRHHYYSRFRDVGYYPAATGIGISFQGIALECMLVNEGKDVAIIPVRNPKQTDSYAYQEEVLVGEGEKLAPQFERGILYRSGKDYRFLISGTASILGQDSVGLQSAEVQTLQTIRNIESLVSAENLQRHCPDLQVGTFRYGYIRVYVKRTEDMEVIKSLCYNHFGEVPTTYVQADICRDNLLVEIEGELISQ